MKRYLFIITILSSLFKYGNAQQLPIYSQYHQNEYLINPAYCGSLTYTPLRITLRKQWLGFTELSPETKIASIHHKISDMGIGGFIYNDRAGNFSRMGLQLGYSYHFQLSDNTKLSLAIAGFISQWTVDQSNYSNLEPNDPLITYSKENYYLPDADAGLLIYNPSFFFSVSASQLFEYRFNAGFSEFDNNYLKRHFFCYSGYNVYLNDIFKLQPSIFVQYSNLKNTIYDINAKFFLYNNYWCGLTYRNSETASVQIGITFKNFIVGYSFDYTYGKISKFGGNSHEIIIGYNFSNKNFETKPATNF